MNMTKKAEKILNTTIKLFLHEGIKKITMDDIAKNSNVSKVTVYKYFVDKDSLYVEVGRHIFSDYLEQLKSIIISGDPLIKKLYGFLEVICDFTDSGKLELCSKLVKCNNSVEDDYNLYLKTYKQTMLTLIDGGIEEELIKGNLDRELIFHYIDMGVVYYQKSSEYRNMILTKHDFQRKFMLFHLNNIFVDGTQILSDL